MIRLIVAGTRRATEEHRAQIAEALHPLTTRGPGVLAHGDAPGVDRIAAAVMGNWGWQVIPVPAAWPDCDLTIPADLGGCPDWPHRKQRRGGGWYCPYAGNRRNQKLVNLHPRADHVLVFPAGSIETRSGTRDLYRRAIRVGLHVHDPIPLEVNRG